MVGLKNGNILCIDKYIIPHLNIPFNTVCSPKYIFSYINVCRESTD